MGRLEELEAENERLLNNRRAEDVQKWSTLFATTSRIETACASCATKRASDGETLNELKETIEGKGDQPGLKTHVAGLMQKMGLIQWVVAAVVVAVLAAAVDRVFNRIVVIPCAADSEKK